MSTPNIEGRWHRKPEVWAVAVAAAALAVSILSWIAVSRQLVLYRGQVRAYVQVLDASLVEPISSASFIKIRLHLKNAGQTAATHIVGEMDYRTGEPGLGEGNSATQKPIAPMGPDIERTVTLTSNRINRRDWPVPHARQMPVYFFGTVWFEDDTTKERRKEDYCFELPLKEASALQSTNLEECGILQYTSKAPWPQ